MLNKFFKRIKEDNGNAILILGIALIIAGLLIGGMMLDISKSYQLKASYINAAKKATQAGIMKQNTSGGLTKYAAAETVRVYENISRPSTVKKDGPFSHCEGKDDVQIKVVFKDENHSGEDVVFTIMRSQVTNDLESIMAAMTQSGHGVLSAKHTGLEMQITESTPNVILPTAFSITKSDDDMKCQELKIKVGATTFLGETDKYE